MQEAFKKVRDVPSKRGRSRYRFASEESVPRQTSCVESTKPIVPSVRNAVDRHRAFVHQSSHRKKKAGYANREIYRYAFLCQANSRNVCINLRNRSKEFDEAFPAQTEEKSSRLSSHCNRCVNSRRIIVTVRNSYRRLITVSVAKYQSESS